MLDQSRRFAVSVDNDTHMQMTAYFPKMMQECVIVLENAHFHKKVHQKKPSSSLMKFMGSHEMDRRENKGSALVSTELINQHILKRFYLREAGNQ